MSSTVHAFLHPLSGLGQGLYGGILGDVSELTLVGGMWMLWRKHACMEPWCWRIQFKPHPDDPHHVVCRKHHREAITPE